MGTYTIALLPGDGIGPEVITEAVKVLEVVGDSFGHTFRFSEGLIGGRAVDATGFPLPPETLDLCRGADAVLLGAVGGPKWDGLPSAQRPETGLLDLRKNLRVYANLRPVVAYPSLVEASPLRPEVVSGTDFLIVRELTGGLYFGKPKERTQRNGQRQAVDTLIYTEEEIGRVVHLAFGLAAQRRKLVTSVDKANVLESSRLWREVVNEVAKGYPEVRLEHMLVDACAMEMVRRPTRFDVIVTENMFGDILSDEGAGVVGSIGLLPSASLGASPPALYEPVHGSAPDIAGQGIANPLGAILSVALLLRHSCNLEAEARAVEEAVAYVLSAGYRTRDLLPPVGAGEYKVVSTSQMGDMVAHALKENVPRKT
ncbi:MAG: 3-isopropylmalate dehydrogenase [Armatimonadota bacterium]|nr:3-isopropylmalate dehydrogenase [Armatimonadota bacterium]